MKNPIEIIRQEHPEYFIPQEFTYPNRMAPNFRHSFLLVDLENKCYYFGKRKAYARAISSVYCSMYACEFFEKMEAAGNLDCFAQFYGTVEFKHIEKYVEGLIKMCAFRHKSRVKERSETSTLYEYMETRSGAVFYGSSCLEMVKRAPKRRAKQALMQMAKCVTDRDTLIKIDAILENFDTRFIRVKVSDLDPSVVIAKHLRQLNYDAAKRFEELVANS